MKIEKKWVLILGLFLLLALGSLILIADGVNTNTIAYYYGDMFEYNKLAAQQAASGKSLNCVARPSAFQLSFAVTLDCYDTIAEADQKLFEYRPDLMPTP
ncbi:MAG: hypothetical protein H7Y11_12920 [Armatimonadetes bacterium]|nr:hypothetical protein [Anaerolineae bacterium]